MTGFSAQEISLDTLSLRLKSARLASGMSLRQLAREAGVSASFVSQIENGRSKPSVANLYKFAHLLNVPVDDLFDAIGTPENTDEPVAVGLAEGWGPDGGKNPSNAWQESALSNRISLVHPSHRPRLTMADGVVWERLAATPEKSLNFMKIIYEPGATSTSGGDLASHDSYEYGYILEGELEVTIGNDVFTLRKGESIGFDSTIPHVLKNIGSTEFQGIWFVHRHRH